MTETIELYLYGANEEVDNNFIKTLQFVSAFCENISELQFKIDDKDFGLSINEEIKSINFPKLKSLMIQGWNFPLVHYWKPKYLNLKCTDENCIDYQYQLQKLD